jgi:hypothetical protein
MRHDLSVGSLELFRRPGWSGEWMWQARAINPAAPSGKLSDHGAAHNARRIRASSAKGPEQPSKDRIESGWR